MRLLWRDRGRHRVEDFARGVDDVAAPEPAENGTSRLVALAHALRSVPLRPAPELTLAVRRRIVNAARAADPEEPRSLLGSLVEGLRLQRGLAATTALLTAAVALVSIGFGTSQALPGDTLYGLKLRGESITIALARSDEARGHSYLQFAGARLRDVSGLIDHDGAWRASAQPVVTNAKRQPEHRLAGLVNSTLTTMNGYTGRGADALRRAYQRTGDTAPLAYLDSFTKKQRSTLSGMLGKLPAASQSVAGQSLNLVDRIGKEANKLLTEECGHQLTCQSEPRPGQTSPSDPVAATPTEAPATSLTSDIQTSGSPEPHQQPTTAPQRTPSTSQQPGTTATPPGTGTTSGDQPTDTTPPGTESSSAPTDTSGGGDSTKDTPSSTDTSGSGSTPAPPQPTGVPSSPADRSDDSSGSDGAATASGDSGGASSTPASDSSAASIVSTSSGSTDSSGGAGDSGTSAGSTDTPPARPVESRDPARQPDQTSPGDTATDQSVAEATPAE